MNVFAMIAVTDHGFLVHVLVHLSLLRVVFIATSVVAALFTCSWGSVCCFLRWMLRCH